MPSPDGPSSSVPDHRPQTAPAPLAASPERRTIATLPVRLRELGRIRLGHQVPTASGKMRPAALDTLRFTSPSRPLVDAAAAAFGGQVQPWQPPDGPAQWQVVTDTDAVEVLLPPSSALDQAYELWRAGGCHRRCDGLVDDLAGAPCQCPTDPHERMDLAARGEACSPVTRLNVMLPQLPDMGVWRVEAHGYYAAVELAAAGHVLDLAATSGRMIAARLRVEPRTIRRPGQPRRDFVVPVLELPHTLGDVLAATGATAAITGPVPAAALGRPVDDHPAAPEVMPPASSPPADELDQGDELTDPAAEPADPQLVATVAEHLDAAGITAPQVGALLRRYHVEALADLRPGQLRTLADTLTDPDARDRLRAALASACVACGAKTAELDGSGRCADCRLPL